MKKGFTLIELLAVIIILAVILVIAVPGISGIIESAQISAFKDDEQLLVKAAKTYTYTNPKYLPLSIGSTKEVTLATLQSNNLIREIEDPKNKSRTCNGYVLITKLGDDDYSYNPSLNCTNNIGNSTDDGLVAYYPFDDFQESTQNYVLNGDIKTLQYWESDPDTSVGGNISKTLITNDGVDDNSSVEYNVISRPSWGYEYHSLRDYIPSGWFSTSSKYTLSFWAKKISGSGVTVVYIHDGNSQNEVMAGQQFTLTSAWKRYEYTFTPLVSGNQPVIFLTTNQGNVYRVDEMQLEKKPNATPFTSGTRTGIVKDYSLNNNKGTLELASTPSWTNKAIVGEGAYSFDGKSSYISLSNNSNFNFGTGPFSVSFWINYKGPTTINQIDGTVLGKATYSSNAPGFFIGVTTYGGNGSNYGLAVSTTNGAWGTGNVEHAGAYLPNTWYYVTVVRNGDQFSIYQNGILARNGSRTGVAANIDNTSNLIIGNGAWNYVNADIDDVRIYSRALNAEEIKYNYDALK